jgi:hypothetical protein
MDLNRYGFVTESTHTNYEFISEGRHGAIRKGVNFQLINSKRQIYNLAFGDFNKDGDIDDLSISDNEDRDKILATVAATVMDFSETHPTATILVTGSTISRTRLYRMGIAKNYDKISKVFDVEGYVREWVPFEKGIEYQAFSIKRRIV